MLGVEGCLDWVTIVDCSDDGNVCRDSGTSVDCISVCDDECSLEGESRCSSDMVQECMADESGCLLWSDVERCDELGQECDDSTDSATCVPTCENGCPSEGMTQCVGATVERCEAGEDGCLDWVVARDCEAAGRACVGGAPKRPPWGGRNAPL
jgi:hypothetical protein